MRHGRKYFWGTVCAAMAVLAVAAAPAGATRSGCLAKGTKAGPRAESSEAIVIRRDGTYWGCAFTSKRSRLLELEGQTDGTRVLPKTIQVKRKNAAYATKYSGRDKTIKVYSFRIGTGRFHTSDGIFFGAFGECPGREVGDRVRLGNNIVLRKNGSIAWAFTFHNNQADEWNRVLAIDGNGAHVFDCDETGDDFDREHKIEPDSLDLFEDSGEAATITWRREAGPDGGAPILRDGDLR
jgi:hypothetical protein